MRIKPRISRARSWGLRTFHHFQRSRNVILHVGLVVVEVQLRNSRQGCYGGVRSRVYASQ